MRKRSLILLVILLVISIAFVISPMIVSRTSILKKKHQVRSIQAHDYNLILISLTNLRADHLSLYHYQRKTSPHIDRLGDQSLVFENAFSPASWTLPVSMSLFTSTFPFAHKIMDRFHWTTDKQMQTQRLNPALTTLVDILKKHGYITAAFTGNRDYNPEFGLISRFDHQRIFQSTGEKDETESREDAKDQNWRKYGVLERIVPPTLQWLNENKDKKFFLFVQAYDLHCPFAVPQKNARFDSFYTGPVDFTDCFWTFDRTEPIVIKKESYQKTYYSLKTVPKDGKNFEVKLSDRDVYHMIALYDGEIYNADQWVNQILTTLKRHGLMKNTIIVLFSEHGDMLGKHGRFMRGGPLRGTFYDDVLHVPLIIYHPDMKPKRIQELVQLIDLAPTLLNFLNLPIPSQFQGKNLMPLIREDVSLNPYVYAGAKYTPQPTNILFNYPSKITMVRDKDWKLIKEKIHYKTGPKVSYELYDIKNDPEELANLSATRKDILESYSAKLESWNKSFKKGEPK